MPDTLRGGTQPTLKKKKKKTTTTASDIRLIFFFVIPSMLDLFFFFLFLFSRSNKTAGLCTLELARRENKGEKSEKERGENYTRSCAQGLQVTWREESGVRRPDR